MLRRLSSRLRLGPVAASIVAGFLAAAAVDVLVTAARGRALHLGGGSLAALTVLALGLYGLAGLLVGAIGAWLVSGVLAAIPGGLPRLRLDERFDRDVAASLTSGLLAASVMAAVAAVGQQALVRTMQSEKLATIAAGGLVLLAAPIAAAVALALWATIRKWLVAPLPRPRGAGVTGTLLLVGLALGALVTLAAFSRADWRVLDLSPFLSLGIIVVAAVGHGLFWYRSPQGNRLAQRLGARVRLDWVSHVVVAGLLAAFLLASRIPEASAAFRAIDQGSLGLRLALRGARAATDGDGDGFSARFGGGDCNDSAAEVHPGAEDVPGNGIDEDCEGGDRRVAVTEDEEEEPPPGASGAAADVGADAHRPAPSSNAPPAGAVPGRRAAFRGSILLITIDAFRADRLGVAGYGRPAGHSLTPNLDALAARGAYFRRVWSQAPNTPRSFPSILTSQTPSSVKWDKPTTNYPVVLPSNHTVFEDLAAAGLAPLGIFSHFYFTADRGISKSFREWSNDGAGTIAESNKDSASPRIVPRVIARLKKAAARRERFVLWTHLFEPHSSYMPHKEFPPSGATGVAGLMEKYDYEIAYVDSWVGRLLKALKDLGLGDSTAVVVMADHGEAWGEHRSFFHGQDLFDEQLRIPLIVAVPGRAPTTVTDPVAALDVAPTLLDLVGASIPRSFRGRSLLPLVDGQALPPRPVYAELMPATAWPHHAAMMVDGEKKIIHRISERRWELYDLARDPGEKNNLVDDAGQHAALEALRAKLLSFEERRR